MQDELKFRVVVFERYNTTEWEFTKFIENTDKFGISTNGNVIQENVEGFIVHLPREKTPINVHRTMEAIQCTGLCDKNGKLIFEGDIVKFPFGNIHKNGIVEYSKTIWNVSNAQMVQGAWVGSALINCYEKSEVIGNIYENPELLEERCDSI